MLQIHGTVEVVVPENCPVTAIGVQLLGEEKVILEGVTSDFLAPLKSTVCNTCCDVSTTLCQYTNHQGTNLGANKHKFRFSISLPTGIPRSCEFETGYIR